MLLWVLHQGGQMQRFANTAKRFGKKINQAQATQEKQLYFGLEFYLDAFIDLDSERSHGMGWTRIPWSSMLRYAVFYDLTDEQTDDLVHYIKQMDTAHIEQLDKKAEEKRNSKEK